MEKAIYLAGIILILVSGCSDEPNTNYTYRFTLIEKPLIPDKERFGYSYIEEKIDTIVAAIYADKDSSAYSKALDLFLEAKKSNIIESQSQIRYDYPDTFYLYNETMEKDISEILSESIIRELRKKKELEYKVDQIYEVYETLRLEPNDAGIRRSYAIVKLNQEYRDEKDLLLRKLYSKMGSNDQYLIVFCYFENPPSLKEWIDNNKLDKDVSQAIGLHRKGKQTADLIVNCPPRKFGDPFFE